MSTQLPDPIKHVVLLMLENRSFDQMLGCLQSTMPELDGIDPAQPRRSANADSTGRLYYQEPNAEKQTFPDPRHELEHVLAQLKEHNSGFVLNYEQHSGRSTEPSQRQQIMSFYPPDFLPALHQLAREFTVCDRWFSSVPGPTWANRFFALSGTSSGQVRMPEGVSDPDLKGFFNQTQDTIFDRLHEANKSWWVYYYDIPCSLIMAHQRAPHQLAHYRNIKHFFAEEVQDERTFPDFVFIEPKYSGVDQNDDHPPHNVVKGDKLIADVYNAIRSNDELWYSTLLIVAFDEHGGFYDHVEPPAAVPPRAFQPGDEYTFDRYGVRVPALLISPWVGARVEHTLFDHTSILKYLSDKWELAPLGARTANANSLGIALRGERRAETVAFIRVPYSKLIPDKPNLEREYVSTHQDALKALSYFFAKEFDVLGTDALATMAKEAGAVARMKSALGGLLMRAGVWLNKDVEQHALAQTKLIEQVIKGVLQGGARPSQ